MTFTKTFDLKEGFEVYHYLHDDFHPNGINVAICHGTPTHFDKGTIEDITWHDNEVEIVFLVCPQTLEGLWSYRLPVIGEGITTSVKTVYLSSDLVILALVITNMEIPKMFIKDIEEMLIQQYHPRNPSS